MSIAVPIVTPGQLHVQRLAGKSPALVDVSNAEQYRAGNNMTCTQEKQP